jgi:hypothetical protein
VNGYRALQATIGGITSQGIVLQAQMRAGTGTVVAKNITWENYTAPLNGVNVQWSYIVVSDDGSGAACGTFVCPVGSSGGSGGSGLPGAGTTVTTGDTGLDAFSACIADTQLGGCETSMEGIFLLIVFIGLAGAAWAHFTKRAPPSAIVPVVGVPAFFVIGLLRWWPQWLMVIAALLIGAIGVGRVVRGSFR